jgi:hypothetical protein
MTDSTWQFIVVLIGTYGAWIGIGGSCPLSGAAVGTTGVFSTRAAMVLFHAVVCATVMPELTLEARIARGAAPALCRCTPSSPRDVDTINAIGTRTVRTR